MNRDSSHPRYPGPRSFQDDELDRRLFCGRAAEAARLLQLVLAEDLVVVYARSGMGKTSLINATLLEPLRARQFLPVVARVNDLETEPASSIIAAVRTAAADADLEVVGAEGGALWQFFRAIELWRGDVLITPVVILDQFEDLFTIQGPASRARLIEELALLRGRTISSKTVAAPPSGDGRHVPVKLLLSMREDSLGELEELAAQIPDILRNRFRLAPLSDREARRAVIMPSRLHDAGLTTAPFKWRRSTVGRLLAFLHKREVAGRISDVAYVEPFPLQLICAHVERRVFERQTRGETVAPIDYDIDIGGDAGAHQIVRGFYDTKIEELVGDKWLLPAFLVRRRVRRLCEEGLITKSGRRSMLDEATIVGSYNVDKTTLNALVKHRLLRAEAYGDQVRYEISHDALLNPIVSARTERKQKTVTYAALAAVALAAVVTVAFSVAWRSDWYINWRAAADGSNLVDRVRGDNDDAVRSWALALAWSGEPALAVQAADRIEGHALRAATLLQIAAAARAVNAETAATKGAFQTARRLAERRVDVRADSTALLLEVASAAEDADPSEEEATWNTVSNQLAGDAQPDDRTLLVLATFFERRSSSGRPLSAAASGVRSQVAEKVIGLLESYIRMAVPTDGGLAQFDTITAALVRAFPPEDSRRASVLDAIKRMPERAGDSVRGLALAVELADGLFQAGAERDAGDVLEGALASVRDFRALPAGLLARAIPILKRTGRTRASERAGAALLASPATGDYIYALDLVDMTCQISAGLGRGTSADSRNDPMVQQLRDRALEVGRRASSEALTAGALADCGVPIEPQLWEKLWVENAFDNSSVPLEGLWRAGAADRAVALARNLEDPGMRVNALLSLAGHGDASFGGPLIEEAVRTIRAQTEPDPLVRGGGLAGAVAWYAERKRWTEATALVRAEQDERARQPMLGALTRGVTDQAGANQVVPLLAEMKPQDPPKPSADGLQATVEDEAEAQLAADGLSLRLGLGEAIARQPMEPAVRATLRQFLAESERVARVFGSHERSQDWFKRIGFLAAASGGLLQARTLAGTLEREADKLEIQATIVRAAAVRKHPELYDRIFGSGTVVPTPPRR